MAHASLVVRQRITALLASGPCQRIDFRYGPDRITGAHYIALALSLNGSSTRRLREEVGRISNGAGAQYVIARNVIRVPNEQFGLGDGTYAADERMSLVHECTHAIFDFVQRTPRINALYDESMAYIAGALFNRHSVLPYANSSDTLWGAADTVAAQLETHPGADGSLCSAMPALRQAIRDDPTYSHLRRNPLLQWRNDGLAL